MEELRGVSNIISLHCLYSTKTHQLINPETIRLIKGGASPINTAREGLIEPAAMRLARGQRILAGAGLEVLERKTC